MGDDIQKKDLTSLVELTQNSAPGSELASPEPETQSETEPSQVLDIPIFIDEEAPTPDTPLTAAPPAGSEHAMKMQPQLGTQKQNLSAVKEFAEQLTIGKPLLEASPAFSVMIT